MDWRALSQVKELGLFIQNCPCMTDDLSKIYGLWSYFGHSLNSTISMGYPTRFDTSYNNGKRIRLKDENSNHTYSTFLTTSPETIKSLARSNELKVLIDSIRNAKEFVFISIMDILPFQVYGDRIYWGELDDSIKHAVSNGIDVKILASHWNATKPQMYIGLKNLQNFEDYCIPKKFDKWCSGNITVKIIELPSKFLKENQINFKDPVGYEPEPFTRVNHAKYVVTDQITYVSTSNWSKDYFYHTLGIGLFTTNNKINSDIKNIFLRDWNSKYSRYLTK